MTNLSGIQKFEQLILKKFLETVDVEALGELSFIYRDRYGLTWDSIKFALTEATQKNYLSFRAKVFNKIKERINMDKTIKNLETYEKAVRKWGAPAQLGIAQEECAELIRAISKYNRSRKEGETTEAINKMAEEIADVQIMLEQLRIIVGDELIEAHYDRKMNRLFQMVHS